ncbi:MOSC domain-containing protein [Litorivicinus sp.]|jgi:uncharacterized protein YcbX|nr:MOSC domain-containing protein [Litorivicinus sp.]|tara:strand:+ start:30215 stop:30940 length:726 start_codon:yes stop_codon:yes gene_type:complete
MEVAHIICYPIKGFAGEILRKSDFFTNSALPGDREFALEYRNRIPPDPSNWRPKKHFWQSTETDLISQILVQWNNGSIRFKHQNGVLQVSRPLSKNSDLCNWISTLAPNLPSFKLVRLKTGFTDQPEPYVSLINLETVNAIAKVTNTVFHPSRYRGNLIISGLEAFAETRWIGRSLLIGNVKFEVIEPIERCKAIECDWHGQRDTGLLKRLNSELLTGACGVFLKVAQSGSLMLGDQVRLD